MHRVDPESLETLEKVFSHSSCSITYYSYIMCQISDKIFFQVDWSKFIAVNGATAHPHYDPDGTSYNMGNSYGRKGGCIFTSVLVVFPASVHEENI